MCEDDCLAARLRGGQEEWQHEVEAFCPQGGGAVPDPEVGYGGQPAGIEAKEGATDPTEAVGDEEEVGIVEGEDVPLVLAHTGHPAAGTEAGQEALAAEPLPRKEEDNKCGKNNAHHISLLGLSDDFPMFFEEAGPSLGALRDDVHAPEDEGERPDGVLDGQEGHHHHPEEAAEEA